jgi:hypothetical protein
MGMTEGGRLRGKIGLADLSLEGTGKKRPTSMGLGLLSLSPTRVSSEASSES